MQNFKRSYIPDPGNRNETSHNDKKENEAIPGKSDEEIKEKKSLSSKIHDALQQWSNDDARDIAEDDSTPLRSGL